MAELTPTIPSAQRPLQSLPRVPVDVIQHVKDRAPCAIVSGAGGGAETHHSTLACRSCRGTAVRPRSSAQAGRPMHPRGCVSGAPSASSRCGGTFAAGPAARQHTPRDSSTHKLAGANFFVKDQVRPEEVACQRQSSDAMLRETHRSARPTPVPGGSSIPWQPRDHASRSSCRKSLAGISASPVHARDVPR